jgi:hypothetical protein
MEDRDRMTLRQLMRYHGAPAVLDALADIAEDESVELRKMRDDEETVSGARTYRRWAGAWERVAYGLRSYGQLLRKKLR